MHIFSDVWVIYDYSGLTVLLWSFRKNMFVYDWIKGCVEATWSSVKIDETWSAVDLRAEAFSKGVVALFQW